MLESSGTWTGRVTGGPKRVCVAARANRARRVFIEVRSKKDSARVHAESGFVPPKWEDQNPSKRGARRPAFRRGMSRALSVPYFRRRRARKPSATTPTASSGKVLEFSGTATANAEAAVVSERRRMRVFI